MDWEAALTAARERHAERLDASLDEIERPDLQLSAVASASWAAGLALLMLDRPGEATEELLRAADEYETSWEAAPPESWGRPIAALRCRLLAGDANGAAEIGRRVLGDGAASSASPFALYAAVLARLALGQDREAAEHAARLGTYAGFPADVAAALLALASGDRGRYGEALESVLASFETRKEFLEDVRVADTALVLEALASVRGMERRPSSPMLPPSPGSSA